jgi:hypothetical protein
MIDYADLSDFEMNTLRAMIFPFWTFYKKNFQRMMPGLAGLGEDAAGAAAANKRAVLAQVQGAGLTTAIALFNHWMDPEMEDDLPPHVRDQVHFNVRYGAKGEKGLTLIFPDPYTIAMTTIGLGGLPQRTLQALEGRTDLGKEAAKGARQAYQSIAGLVSPAINVAQANLVTGRDIRTGKAITHPDAPASENLQRRLSHALGAATPLGGVGRVLNDPEIDSVDLGTTGRDMATRFLTGGLLRATDLAEEKDSRAYEASGQAKAEKRADDYQKRLDSATPLIQEFQALSRKDALAKAKAMVWAPSKDGNTIIVDTSRAAIIGEAFERLAAINSKWKPILSHYRKWQDDNYGRMRLPVGDPPRPDKLAPYRQKAADRLRPDTDRQQPQR